ncbi:hypothetical protein PCE1_002221 [Barthelona sp. PCE]
MFELKINRLNGGSFHLSVEHQTTVQTLRNMIAEETLIDQENQLLLFSGRQLRDNDATLESMNITEECTINLAVRPARVEPEVEPEVEENEEQAEPAQPAQNPLSDIFSNFSEQLAEIAQGGIAGRRRRNTRNDVPEPNAVNPFANPLDYPEETYPGSYHRRHDAVESYQQSFVPLEQMSETFTIGENITGVVSRGDVRHLPMRDFSIAIRNDMHNDSLESETRENEKEDALEAHMWQSFMVHMQIALTVDEMYWMMESPNWGILDKVHPLTRNYMLLKMGRLDIKSAFKLLLGEIESQEMSLRSIFDPNDVSEENIEKIEKFFVSTYNNRRVRPHSIEDLIDDIAIPIVKLITPCLTHIPNVIEGINIFSEFRRRIYDFAKEFVNVLLVDPKTNNFEFHRHMFSCIVRHVNKLYSDAPLLFADGVRTIETRIISDISRELAYQREAEYSAEMMDAVAISFTQTIRQWIFRFKDWGEPLPPLDKVELPEREIIPRFGGISQNDIMSTVYRHAYELRMDDDDYLTMVSEEDLKELGILDLLKDDNIGKTKQYERVAANEPLKKAPTKVFSEEYVNSNPFLF